MYDTCPILCGSSKLNQNLFYHIGTCLKNCLVVKNIMIKNKYKPKTELPHYVYVFSVCFHSFLKFLQL